MLTDKSPDFAGTWSFLDSRMSEIGTVSSTVTGSGNPSDAVVAAGAGAAAIGGALVSLAGPAAVGIVGTVAAGGKEVIPSLINAITGIMGDYGETKGRTGERGEGGEDGEDGWRRESEDYNSWQQEDFKTTTTNADGNRTTANESNVAFDAGAVFK